MMRTTWVSVASEQAPSTTPVPITTRRGCSTGSAARWRRIFRIGGSIALMAAGGGREVLALRRLSFRVDAWECQPDFVIAANELLVAEGYEPSVTFAPPECGSHGHRRLRRLDHRLGCVHAGSEDTLAVSRCFERFGRRSRPAHRCCSRSSPVVPADVGLRVAAAVGNLLRRTLGRAASGAGRSPRAELRPPVRRGELAAELAAGGFELEYFAAAPYGHTVALAATPSGSSISEHGDRI